MIIKFGFSRLEKLKFSFLFALQNIKLRNKVSIFSLWQIKLLFSRVEYFSRLKKLNFIYSPRKNKTLFSSFQKFRFFFDRLLPPQDRKTNYALRKTKNKLRPSGKTNPHPPPDKKQTAPPPLGEKLLPQTENKISPEKKHILPLGKNKLPLPPREQNFILSS